ncbi:MAG: SDR family oxidoreductase [Chloroflexi bacterium]|nr:SDR family oxidoreductase [Chloroflexota bacterium]
MDLGLAGTKVFVAASRSGLGAATARRFSLEGASVAINGRQLETLKETARMIERESGHTVWAIDGDIQHEAGAKRVIETAIEQLGGLDILVTNAGGPPPGTFEKFQMSDWESAYRSLMAAPIQMIQAALPALRQSKQAAILLVTSLTTKQAGDNLILSNVMRAGLAGLVKSLANELGPSGIRINAILPGWTETERVTQILSVVASNSGLSMDEERAKRQSNIPLGRMGRPEEFGNVAAFICSPAGGFIHGALIPVDGGEIRATM